MKGDFCLHNIYDRVFKKIITLSSKAVINLINGLYGTDYSTDSSITYNWTEFESDELRTVLADTIITIDGKYSYHLEAQITGDDSIILRVFEYGFNHAMRNPLSNIGDNNSYILRFPESIVIYLYSKTKIPDTYNLVLDFGTQGTFNYSVPTFKFLEKSLEEINSKKLIILIPFQLLKLKDRIEKSRSKEDLDALKNLIQNDIIRSIEENLRVGNITENDARRIKRLTHKLYEHIYSHYEEMEELNDMTDESLMLDIDIIEKKHEQELAEKEKEYEQELAEKEKEYEQQLTKKDKEYKQELEDKDKEILRLKKLVGEIDD